MGCGRVQQKISPESQRERERGVFVVERKNDFNFGRLIIITEPNKPTLEHDPTSN